MANEHATREKGTKERVEQTARDAAHRAREQAQDIGERAREQTEHARAAAGEAAEYLRHEAEELGREARGVVDSFVRSMFRGLAERTDAIAQAFHHAADDLDKGEMPAAGKYARRAAERTREACDYLENSGIEDIVDDSADFARRNPEVVLGAAFVAGLAAARFIKASQERREHRDLQHSAGQTDYGHAHSGGGGYASRAHASSGPTELRTRSGIAEPVAAGNPRWADAAGRGAAPHGAGEGVSPGRGTSEETVEASSSSTTNTGRSSRAEQAGTTPTSAWHAQRQSEQDKGPGKSGQDQGQQRDSG